MAGVKSLVSMRFQVAVMLLLAVALGSQIEMGEAQNTCSTQLTNLNVCAPFVVPGAANTSPSSDCCTALRAVNQDCICNTIRVASQLPTQCQLPALSCDAN